MDNEFYIREISEILVWLTLADERLRIHVMKATKSKVSFLSRGVVPPFVNETSRKIGGLVPGEMISLPLLGMEYR